MSCGLKTSCMSNMAFVLLFLFLETDLPDASVVPPSQPRVESGLYWGYTVRLAHTFGAVFTQSPYESGYDVSVGTSEKGDSVDKIVLPKFR